MRTAEVEKRYMTDDSICVGIEWEGVSSNQPLPSEEVRCENVQNSGLDEIVSDKQTLPRN